MKGIYTLFIFFSLSFFTSVSLLGQQRFWVGNSGDWNDTQHWSLTSGGAPGATVPTDLDDAIFDAASFSEASEIDLPSGIVSVKDLSFAAIDEDLSLEASSVTSQLAIHGDFIGSANLSGVGFIYWVLFFEGAGIHTLTSNGCELPTLYLNDEDVEVSILDDLDLVNIDLSAGSLVTNGNDVTVLREIDFFGSGIKSMDIDDSTIECSVWDANASNVSFTAVDSHIKTGTIQLGTGLSYDSITIDKELLVGFTSQSFRGGTSTHSDIEFLYFKDVDVLSITYKFEVNDRWLIKRGMTIDFNFESDIILNGDIELEGDPCEFTRFIGSVDSTPRMMEVSTDQNLDQCIFKNLEVVGPGVITAENSLEDINVSGIIFNAPSITTLYWIGGAGDFNDLSHFSLTSGGVANATCLPGPFNNIVFDENSGLDDVSVINFPVGEYAINDIGFQNFNWTTTLNFEGVNFNNFVKLVVYGDIVIPESVQSTYANYTYNQWFLSGSQMKTIDSNNFDFGDFNCEIPDVTVELNSDFRASSKFVMRKTDFVTNGYTIESYEILMNLMGCGGSSDCPIISYDFDGSLIKCHTFNSEFNYGKLELNGDYKIEATNLFLSRESLDTVLITAYDNTSSGNAFLEVIIGEINSLTIDLDNELSIRGDLSLIEDMNIEQVNVINMLATGVPVSITTEGDINILNTGDCGGLIDIMKIGESPARIIKESGVFTINNASIQRIETEGGAIFDAIDCTVSSGYESYWNITDPPTRDFYWVGGHGNWTDYTNWSDESGGVPQSSECLPRNIDRVFFDENSFSDHNQEVMINANEFITAKDIIWTSDNYSNCALSFTNSIGGNGAILNVSGDINLLPSMILNPGSSNEIHFIGLESNITIPGQTLPRIEVADASTSLNLMTDLIVQSIFFTNGILNTNNHELVTEDFYTSSSSSNCKYNLGTSDITVNGYLDFNLSSSTEGYYDADSATITCSDFDFSDGEIYRLILNNTFSINPLSRDLVINELVMSGNELRVGTGFSTLGSMSIDHLIFNSADAILSIQDFDGLIINESIESNVATGSPIIKARSQTTADLIINDNMCVDDEIEFQNINVENFVFNCPNAIDGGGNFGIDFTSYTDENILYWIGGSGNWDHPENWSFASGACPAGTGAISTKEELIFDDNSFSPGENEITFLGNRTAQKMTFTNSDIEAVFKIPYRFRPEIIEIDGGNVFITDPGVAQNRAVQVFEHVHVFNGGTLEIDSTVLHIARRPNDLTESALWVDEHSTLKADKSSILISGHGNDVELPTVDLEVGAIIDADDSTLKTFAPLSGQPNNALSFDLNNTHWQNLEIDNNAAVDQISNILSSFSVTQLKLFNGQVIVEEGVELSIE